MGAAQYAVVFMLAIIVVIMGVAMAFPVNQMSTLSQNTTSVIGGMDCSNSSISDYTKATCWISDAGQGVFIGSVFALAGALIIARLLT